MKTEIPEEHYLRQDYIHRDVENILDALRPYLLHRQQLARTDYDTGYLWPHLEECNIRIIKLLSLPQTKKPIDY